MTTTKEEAKRITLANAPSIPGLSFRRYCGKEDLAEMAEVMTRSRTADGIEFVTTAQDLTASFENPQDFDPGSDILIAEVDGKMIGLARMWHERRRDMIVHGHSVELVPEWRGKGIREFLFEHNEKQIRAGTQKKKEDLPAFCELWTNDADNEWKSIVAGRGYKPVQHEIDLVRDLDNIPDMPLPKGIEVRPVRPEHLRKIWEANKEAWLQDWNFSEDRWSEASFEKFTKSSWFQPDLWQVAWDGDTLAGMVLNYITGEENREYNKKRGHPEHVFVREAYRGRGLARALLSRSLKLLKECGMDEAMLSTEIENPHGALRLYEGMGFKTVRHFTWHQKPVR